MERVSQKKIFSGILVALLLLLRFTPSAYAADASERYEEIIDRVASEYVGSTVPGALVMISEHGETVFSKGYGFADLNNRVPMDAESTVFEWGSISKTFVWVSVMQLVEAGKIDLQTDIRAYLPDGFLKNLQYDETVTMLHLMNHTAGFEEELLDLRYTGEDEERPLREVLSSHQPKQAYRPGTICAYFNYGAALAALIVEEVSGESYKEYVTEHILTPLGMERTSVGPFWSDVSGLIENKATGYSYAGSGFKREDEMHLRMYPAGAMNGTASDLLLFARELAKAPGEETLLFQDLAFKERLFGESWHSYGANAGLSHGFWQYVDHPGILGHEGGTYGFKTQFWVEPARERAILILTNVMETDFCSAVMEALITNPEKPFAESGIAEDVSPLTGDYLPARSVWSHVGRVQGRMQIISIAEAENGTLRLTMPFGEKDLLYEPLGDHMFYCADALPEEQILAFTVSDGAVCSMSFRLAHDYVPAGACSGAIGSILQLAVYLLMALLWITLLVAGFIKMLRGKSSFELLLPVAGAVFGLTGIVGMLHWFSIYNIIRAEINAIAVAGIVCAILGIVSGVILYKKRKKISTGVFTVLFGIQILAAWSLGFLTVI